jgi:hypothetical protein
MADDDEAEVDPVLVSVDERIIIAIARTTPQILPDLTETPPSGVNA